MNARRQRTTAHTQTRKRAQQPERRYRPHNNTLVENGAYEDAMNGLDWAEKARYENAVTEIVDLLRVMPLNEGAASGE